MKLIFVYLENGSRVEIDSRSLQAKYESTLQLISSLSQTDLAIIPLANVSKLLTLGVAVD
jgi:hypothetical protein